MSTIAPPTPQRQASSRFIEQGSTSTSHAETSYVHESSMSDSELSAFDFASDDDEAGVFFGAHNPIEHKIVASLSRSIPPSPASCSLSTIAEPRRASLAASNRVRNNDSREFLRRRTLLHGDLEKSLSSSAEERSDGTALDMGSEVEDNSRVDPPQPEAGPSSHRLPAPSFARADPEPTREDTPEQEMPSFHVEEGMFTDIHMSDDDETDKENTMVPEMYYDSEDEMEYTSPVEHVDDKPITLGFTGVGPDDISGEIDMGGLSLFDLDDPDLGPLEDTSIAFDPLGDDTDPSEFDGSIEKASSSVFGDPFLERRVSLPETTTPLAPAVSLNNMFMTVHQSSPVPSPDVPRPAISSESSPQPLMATPVKQSTPPQTFPQTPSGIFANTSYDSEIDSPIVARAPVALPVFSVCSPSSSMAPLRGLEPGPSSSNPPPPPEMAMTLPSLDSPPHCLPPSVTPRRLPPSMAPLPKTPGSVLKNRTPPTTRPNAANVPVSLRPERILKASQRVEATPADEEKARRRAARAEVKAKERAAAIRGQLDFMVTSTMASFDPLARSSASPAKADKSPHKSPHKSPRTGSTSVRPDKASRPASRPMSVSAPSRTQTVPVGTPKAIERRLPVPVPSGIPVPKSAKPAVSTGIPRPILKRTVIPSSVQRSTTSKLAEVKLAATSLNVRPEPSPVTSLKRPFSAIQTSERAALTVGSAPTRPGLGLPTRPLREPMREATGIQTLSFSTGHAVAFSHSPARTSVMGKPVRPTGMTPTAQRTTIAPAPLRAVASTPLKQPPFRPTPVGSNSKTVTPLSHPIPRHFSVAPAPLMPRLSEARSEAPADDDTAKMDADTPPVPAPAQQRTDAKMGVEESAVEQTNGSSDPPTTASTDSSAPTNGSAPHNGSAPTNDAAPTNGQSSIPRPSPPEQPEPSSPTPARGARRSGRTTRPPPPARTPAAPKPKAAAAPSIVPGVSERQLRSATQQNTRRNQVYLCAIDRQIVRVPGPRPPSPTSKIPKSAERDEEEQKAARDARAKRRGRPSDDTSSEVEEDAPPVVEVVHQALGPGDDEEYTTPVRPAKRARLNDGSGADTSSNGATSTNMDVDAEAAEPTEKVVRWNRALTVIRGGLGEVSRSSRETTADSQARLRSCLKTDAQIALDEFGNVINAKKETLKRSKVTIQAVFYDGEEPVPFNYNATASQSTRSKKK